MKRLVWLIFYLFVYQFSANAQTGILRGKVIDARTAEELIGTTVMLVGTLRGAATDLDGKFSVSNIEHGTYHVKVSFISYETQVIAGVKILADEIEVLNISLQPKSVVLSEVVVLARAMKNTEASVLTLQRKSATVIDGISSQQMSRTDDGDAASALRRVTGISVEGGKYVYVRGLGDRYSSTALNGAVIPGLDPNRNTVQMDLFPSNVIDNMIVYKTFSPELSADFTGGHIDVITKDFPERLTFQFSTSACYNANSSWNDEFLTHEGGKMDWLGYDDGTRDIPDDALGTIPQLYFDNEQLDNITTSFNNIWAPKTNMTHMDHNHSISVGNQVNLFETPFGYFAGLSYNRNYNYYDKGVVGRYRLVGSNSENLNKDLEYKDRKGTMEAIWGALLNLSYKFSNNHKLNANMMYNHSGTKLTRYMFGEVQSDGTGRFRQTRTLSFKERSLSSVQLKGEHYFEKAAKLKVDWILSFTFSNMLEPDLRFFTNSFYPDAVAEAQFSINTSEYADPARYYRDMVEYNWDNRLNFTLPFNLMGTSSKIKFGGAYTFKDRNFVEKRFNFTTQQPEKYDGNLSEYFRNSNIGQAGIDPVTQNYGIYVQNSIEDDQTNSYDARQVVGAGYMMVDMSIYKKLRMIFGLRFETTDVSTISYNLLKPKGELNTTDFLPAFNLTYLLNEKMNLRAAYTRTLARPSFRELAPYANFEFQGDYTVVGNGDLERTLIDNVDLRWEWFPKPEEMLSLSLFYKRFMNPIERTFNPQAGNDELTWRNVAQGQVAGVEAEFRKQLDFSEALSKFRFGFNIAYIKSWVMVDPEELETIHATEPEYPETRVMFGQSPYIVNALLSFDNNEKGWHSNLSYNVVGRRLVTVILGGTPNIFEQPAHMVNFNISKLFGEHTFLKLSAENLLNAGFTRTYTRWDEKSTWKGEEYIYEKYQFGMKFSLGFVYKI